MKIALTGGATGIGAALAKKLKMDGHHVTAFDVSEPAENVDRWIKTDLSNSGSIKSAIDQAEGPFDALVNNAGLPPRDGLSELILNVNFIGFREFLEGMIGKLTSGASIVNTASRAGAMWRDNLDEIKALFALKSADDIPAFIASRSIDPVRAYNLSKEAVIVYSMAQTENMIARKLRINSISPAAVSTGILDDFTKAFGDRVAKNIARAGRPGTAEEVADIIAFIASPESSWLKGVDIIVDGGMSAMAQTDMFGLKDKNSGANL